MKIILILYLILAVNFFAAGSVVQDYDRVISGYENAIQTAEDQIEQIEGRAESWSNRWELSQAECMELEKEGKIKSQKIIILIISIIIESFIIIFKRC